MSEKGVQGSSRVFLCILLDELRIAGAWVVEFTVAIARFWSGCWTRRQLLIVLPAVLFWCLLFLAGSVYAQEAEVHDESTQSNLILIQQAQATQTAVLVEVRDALGDIRGRDSVGVVDNSRLAMVDAWALAVAKVSLGGVVAAMALVGLAVAGLVRLCRR